MIYDIYILFLHLFAFHFVVLCPFSQPMNPPQYMLKIHPLQTCLFVLYDLQFSSWIPSLTWYFTLWQFSIAIEHSRIAIEKKWNKFPTTGDDFPQLCKPLPRGQTFIFPWFSYGVPMIFPFSYGFCHRFWRRIWGQQPCALPADCVGILRGWLGHTTTCHTGDGAIKLP